MFYIILFTPCNFFISKFFMQLTQIMAFSGTSCGSRTPGVATWHPPVARSNSCAPPVRILYGERNRGSGGLGSGGARALCRRTDVGRITPRTDLKVLVGQNGKYASRPLSYSIC